MKHTTLVGGTILIIFFIGVGYIVSEGRPVVLLQEELREAYRQQEATVADEIENTDTDLPVSEEKTSKPTTTDVAESPVAAPPSKVVKTETPPKEAVSATEETPPTPPDTLTFTMATIAQHNTTADCWSAINGGVYDLSTWVSRHPGGSRAITRLCGTDGSSSFNREHGRSRAAANALLLLKIGDLQ